MRVRNEMDEVTTTHWHGMSLPAVADGGPHSPIEPGATWTPTWRVDQPAATLWYHPHPHERTEHQVRLGLAGMVLVDPQYPDEVRLMSRLTPALTAFTERMSRGYPNPFVELLRRCAGAIRAGNLRMGGPDPDGCLSPQWPANYPPELKAVLAQRINSATPEALAHAWDILAAINSLESLDANAHMVVNAGRMFHVPISALYRGSKGLVTSLTRAQLQASATAQAGAHVHN